MSNLDRPVGECVFCELDHRTPGRRISGEHLFSDWTLELVPQSDTNKWVNSRHSLDSVGDAVFISPKFRERSGRVERLNLTGPCKHCNETWMSTIEQSCIPILTPWIVDGTVTLSEDHQRHIAAWGTLRSIILELDDPPNAAISRAMRQRFFNAKGPDESHWKVWLGIYSGSWARKAHHRGFTIGSAAAAPILKFAAPNTQASTFVIGKLCLHVFSTFCPSSITREYHFAERSDILTQVWPVDGTKKPPPKRLNDEDLTFLESAFSSAVEAMGIRNLGVRES